MSRKAARFTLLGIALYIIASWALFHFTGGDIPITNVFLETLVGFCALTFLLMVLTFTLGLLASIVWGLWVLIAKAVGKNDI